eukprot:CAMPEP_0117426880 /NCGR_PEP_ID=MMETSP0758-20121206/6874_1 /TAXON_ID=63605 /ORGANISM="Percolomonas cosmopolitus, Strain AE-1 (ATCC 50343)" /LENGTH=54 /DNA_ID=CAMNT_0005212251 /DNA_START=349 /DNA_END=510 /DNA_ORIENTATION=-
MIKILRGRKRKRTEAMKQKILELTAKRDWKEVCDAFATEWYDGSVSIYSFTEDD